MGWRIEEGKEDPILVLVWNERGGHIDSDTSVRRGFGREVLETMLSYELGARTEMVFEPTGLRFTLRLPFTQRIGRHTTEETSVAAEDVTEPNPTSIGER